MKLDKVANSGNDEFYTPRYAVRPIIKYLKAKEFLDIWCPFDTGDSNFVKLLRESGFNVINTHISNDGDFFEIDTPPCDAIVSNPPYSMKAEVLENLFLRKIPFAMLLGVVGIFESERRFSMFEQNTFEILYFNRRVAYFKSFEDQKPSLNPPFSSVYITSNILPEQICFERIDKKDF